LPPEYSEVTRFSLGRELSPGEEGCCRFAASCFRTERIALRLTARAEQTAQGLSVKLMNRGHDSPCVRAVLAHLVGLNIVNDSRYAVFWFQSRLSRGGSSPRRLRAALCGRGIDRDASEEAWEKVFSLENELSLLESYIRKKKLKPSPDFNSIKYILKYEGFSRDVLEQYQENLESGKYG
jgi:regulatory protein